MTSRESDTRIHRGEVRRDASINLYLEIFSDYDSKNRKEHAINSDCTRMEIEAGGAMLSFLSFFF